MRSDGCASYAMRVLCIQAMFSYTTMFSIHGDIVFADRAEQASHRISSFP